MLATTTEVHGGRRVRVARLGTGPPLVLLHGYPDTLQIFSAIAPRLAATHEVIAFDWPGMGASEPWDGGTTPWHQAERLRTMLDAWQLGPATIVGTDMGGQPALVLAAEHPGYVSRLVVSNSLVIHDAPTSWEIRLLRRYRSNEWILRTFPQVVLFRAEHTFLPRGTRLPDELRADFRDHFGRPAVRQFVSRLCGGYQGSLPRLPALFGRIRCPTLVLWAAHDAHFPLVHAERLHAHIPGSKLVVLEDAHHWMYAHAPDAVAAALTAFA